MVTIKLKKPPTPPGSRRAPVRGAGAVARPRPTLAEAQAEREAARKAAASAPDPTPARARPTDPRRDRPGPGAPRPREARRPPDTRSSGPPAARRPDAPRVERGRRDAAPGERERGDLSRREPPQRPDPNQRAAPDPRPRHPAPTPPVRGAPAGPRRETSPRPVGGPAAGPAPRKRRPFDRGPDTAPRAGPEPRRAHDDDDDEVLHALPEHAPGSVRLSKRMSELGIASRREADEWIAKGWVRVDDRIVSELGSRVLPGQRVTVDAKARFQQAQRVTVLVHKPVGFVSGQAEDGYEPAVVLVTPENQWREDRSGTRFLREHLKSLVPAGRLDIDSVGLLVLTQDGRVAKQLIGEESEIEKEYLVRVAPAAAGSPGLSDAGLALLRHGLELDGEALRPATVEWVNADQLRFVLTQGKKRQIRRMCEAVSLHVLGLKRVRIGAVMLGDLPPGQWRYLRRDESFG